MSTREDYINALSLVRELVALHHREKTSTEKSILELLRHHYSNGGIFSRKDIETLTGYSKTHSQRIILQLLRRELIEQAGGSKNRGYRYRLIETE